MLHLFVAAALHVSGDYEPQPPPTTESSLSCGTGTVQVGSTCEAPPAASVVQPQATVVVSQPPVLIPTGFGFGGTFVPFHHWR